MDGNLGRVQLELYKEIKKVGWSTTPPLLFTKYYHLIAITLYLVFGKCQMEKI